jgi:error-prone DNA polymerase
MGVFQIESRAQMASLLRTLPESLDDLTIQVAIVRPGPIQGGAVNPYIARKQKLREDPSFVVPYEHPSLEPVLKDTLGTIIFQDQVLEVAMAFAGLSPGEAEGLRRAMSRKRSAAALEAYHRRFVEGAMALHAGTEHPVDEAACEQIWQMIQGFSGFGFPKAHGAAFGLLAYQSTWLRVHYKPEFLCALLNEQPMGFYPSDTLCHEAQRSKIPLLAPDVNESEVLCSVDADGSVRIGLGYVSGVRADEVAALVSVRNEGGRFRSIADLASRAGAGRPSLEQLAWSGACDSLIASTGAASHAARRTALWQLGVASPGVKLAEGTQLALPLDVPEAPELRPLDAWQSMVADYATTGLTLGAHPMALVRPSLGEDVVSCCDLPALAHDTRVRIGGLVVARQRPGTANGIVFMLLEDEFGTINLVITPQVYERHRLTVRSEPLVIAEGKLEKLPLAGGAINVFVSSIRPIEVPGEAADVVELAERTEAVPADFRAVSPPVQSFASGRRR